MAVVGSNINCHRRYCGLVNVRVNIPVTSVLHDGHRKGRFREINH